MIKDRLENVEARPVSTDWQQMLFKDPELPIPIFQYDWEFRALLDIYKNLRPWNVMEIGTFWGGTLYYWLKNAQPNATVISLDMAPFPGPYNEKLWRSWSREDTELHIVQANSHMLQTAARIDSILNGRKLDFLLIDADHGYEGAKQDLLLYGDLVKPGGVIVMHDILYTPRNPQDQVYRLWQEIRSAGFVVQELYSKPDQDGAGIGLIHVQ